jgi:hypothetical protein
MDFSSEKEARIRRMYLPTEKDVHMKRMARQHDVCLNPVVGEKIIDHENVDYRYDETAGTGAGGVSKPQGPDVI